MGTATPDTSTRSETPWALRLIPPFPAVAHRILAVANEEDVSIDRVGQLIKMDPAFSVELLRIANSALFGARREIASLQQAIVMLGIDRVKSMATCVALQKMVASSVKAAALRKVWIHSLVTAVVAEELARAARPLRDLACTAGLLHNLGTLGLMSSYPAEYSRILEISDSADFDILQNERELFEVDHCTAGACLAKAWDFPDVLAAAIATHHDLPAKGAPSLGLLLQISWRLADALGYHAFAPVREWSLGDLLAFMPPAGGSWLAGEAEAAKERVGALIAAWPV